MPKSKDQRTKRRGGGAVALTERKTHQLPKRQQSSTFSLRIVAALTSLSLLLLIVLAPIFYPKEVTELVDTDLTHSGADASNLNRVQDFLDNFVCHYKPNSTNGEGNWDKLDIPGYCHPKLVSLPSKRTHIVSSSHPWSMRLPSKTAWWKRTLFPISSDKIVGGELIMELPRPLQIWDLDALRDEFIQQHFLGLSTGRSTQTHRVALHKETSNPLDSGAYLAVYLLRLLHGSQRGTNLVDYQCKADEGAERINSNEVCQSEDGTQIRWNDTKQQASRIELLTDYLGILPTYADRRPSSATTNFHEHPITWPQSVLESLFPKYTHTYNLITNYQKMVQSEYDALKYVSPCEFGNNVNFTDYLGMRVNVLSRAFGAIVSGDGIGSSWNAIDVNQTVLDELQSYVTSNFGARNYSAGLTGFTQSSQEFKFRSMCPLLDMYNSHPNPNAVWKHDSTTSSYLVHAHHEGIPTGHEIMVSYGKYTEGHLFAKYGYVNGDGSSKTEASLSVFHRMIGDIGLGLQYSPLPFHVWDQNAAAGQIPSLTNLALEIQSKELLRYLMFDDGYIDCIWFEDQNEALSKEQELKLLKLQHMQQLANIADAWVVRLPARRPNTRPLQDSTIQQSNKNGEESRVGIDAKGILSICRLLSLTVDDIDGGAIDYLKDGISNGYSRSSLTKHSYFQVEKHESTLEYRALMCVVRLSDIALKRYGRPNGNNEPKQLFSSREWAAWYIRDGETRLLSLLQQTAASEASRLKNQLQLSGEGIFMRERSCPLELSLPILKIVATT